MLVKDVTKKETKYLNVYEFKDRTIAIYRAENIEQLLSEWEKAQLELASNYQYEDESSKIWDYYLVLICNFKDEESDLSWKFKIESDRFCCRKIVIFEHEKHKLSIEKIVTRIFPDINLSSNIELLSLEEFNKQLVLKEASSFEINFLTSEFNEEEINSYIEMYIKDK